MGDQLAQEDDFGADIVGEGRDVGGLQGQGDGGNGSITGRREYAIERPIVRVRCGSSVSEKNKLSASRETITNRQRGVGDCLGLIPSHLHTESRVFSTFI